jgi:iron complex outermembrane receptor protein
MKNYVTFFIILTLLAGFGFSAQLSAKEKDVVELKEIVVTATRDWEEERKVPYNVTVITEEDIVRSNAQSVADILRTVPGVVVSDLTANRKSITVDIRGFGETGSSNTLVLVDGRRVNQVDLSGTDWVQVPLDQVERIEVLRGGGSVLYGDNAVGGIVNIITKKGVDKPSVQSEFVGGSYQLNIQRVSSRGVLGGFRYAVHARREDTDGFRDNGNYEGYDFGGSIGYDIGDFIKWDFSANYHGDDFGLPGALSEVDLQTMKREDTKNPDDEGETEDYYVRLKGELDFKSWGRLILDSSYRKRRSQSRAISTFGTFTLDSDIPTLGVTPRWVWEKDVWGVRNKLIVGFDYYHSNSEFNSQSSFGSSRTDIERDSWGAYFYDEVSLLTNLILSIGYRYEGIENIFKGSSNGTSIRDEKDEVMNAWDVGVTYIYLDKSKIYGRVAKSYRYPLIDEYFSVFSGLNRDLDSQEGVTFETGIDHSITANIRAGFSVFYMELDDEIFLNPLTFANENYDKTRRRGVEVFGEATPWKWLRLWANYTFIKATFGGGSYNDNDVPMVPRCKASFGIDLTTFEGLSLNIWANYVGKRHFISDQANEVEKLDDYMTVNAKVSYSWRFLTAFIGVNNIFNEQYSEYGVVSSFTGLRNFYPSPGINVLGGLSLTF